MEYQEYMNNLRNAFKVIRHVMPEVLEVAKKRAFNTKDGDLNILLMSDDAWLRAQEKYEKVAPKLYQFNPEEEYGAERR